MNNLKYSTLTSVFDSKEFHKEEPAVLSRNISSNSFPKQQNSIFYTTLHSKAHKIDALAEELKEKYYEIFITTVKYEELEDTIMSKSELLYSEIVSKYGYILSSNFVNTIFKESLQKQDVKSLISILNLISNVNHVREIDIFSVIALTLLHHSDVEIVDKSISCFAKWGRKEDADILSSFQSPSEEWLAEFFNKTIDYLRSQ